MIRNVEVNGKAISYTLERKDVKNINLRIRADQGVFVSASKDVPAKMLDSFVKQKADYILRSLKRFKEKEHFASPDNTCVDGESVTLFGRNLRLCIKYAAKSRVECDESFVTLFVNDINDTELKKKTLDKWLKNRCRDEIAEICKKVFQKVRKYGVSYPEIQLREMVSRWGSCVQKKGLLTFNTSLVAAPVSCIEYVVTHEFTHLLYPSHSKTFYQQLATFMPDWEERKARLEALHV
ncbi:hypothetical protein SAMN05720766_12011 [Fibrobacter sp. UWH9]|jgi:predicted metal-dependent hydrolase|uniref:M48 family metallopeptidase n=1 Tax=Fibrobacter sp. UWH9 TaxID=1896213 RepID=UPI0009229A18|nr:SprT family zinc-dependent metalloprotease [Fibrobacter sp. UWH9]SHH70664.1 hypothetical protein SAMN05720766_12011 [Fibrobacter sp. UWH9]